MYRGSQRGWMEIIAGVMFSGKSEELIRRVRRAVIARQQVQVFKSHIDDRYGGLYAISTHDGSALHAEPVDNPGAVLRQVHTDTTVVAIDEVQFLDGAIVDVATELVTSGRRVILAGTDTDFRGEPFGAMPTLMSVAEIVDKLHAICVVCGEPACRNQRLVDGVPATYESPTIFVGGSESYQARCRHCHEVPKADAKQTSLFGA